MTTPMTPEEARAGLERIERQQQEHREHRDRIDRAWASPEATAVREFVIRDGNITDWRGFVSHVGGILNVVAMVDQYGRPDPARIVPRIDELFYAHYSRKEYAGFTVTRHPNNRPYKPQPGDAQPPQFPGDGMTAEDVEKAIAEEQRPPRRTTARR